MDRNPFSGLGTALITPFKEDGSVDSEALAKIVEKQLAEGVDFFCVLGTTAETPCLTTDEKRHIMQLVKELVGGRRPLLLGAGGNCTAQVVEYLKKEDLTGYDGVLIVVPYYNKPTQEGIYQHFKAVAENSPLPVVLYNVPGRTGVNMTAETTLRLAHDFKKIVGIKEASGNLEQATQIIKECPAHFNVICGDDALTFDMISNGAKGVISVLGNIYTAEFGEMVHILQKSAQFTDRINIQSDLKELLLAKKLHQSFKDMYSLLFKDGNPAGIKYVMNQYHLCRNILRLPLVPVSHQTEDLLNAGIKDLQTKGFQVGNGE